MESSHTNTIGATGNQRGAVECSITHQRRPPRQNPSATTITMESVKEKLMGKRDGMGKDMNDNVTDAESGMSSMAEVLTGGKILPKILSYLQFPDLLESRHVCHAWNTAICTDPLLAKRCVVTIRHSVDSVLTLFMNSRTLADASARRLGSRRLSTPSSFRFMNKLMSNSTIAQLAFWKTLGTHIKYLDFSQHSLGAVSFLEILMACPNLLELSFDCDPICLPLPPNGVATGGSSPFIDSEGQAYIFQNHEGHHYQKLIPSSEYIQQAGLLHCLESLNVTNSNRLPPGVLSDLLQWGGGELKCLSLMDDQPGISTLSHHMGAPMSKNLFMQRSLSAGLKAALAGPAMVMPNWDVRHVLFLIEHQAPPLVQLELCGVHIQPEHVHALAKIKHLKLRVLKLRGVQADTKSLISLFQHQKYLEELDLSYSTGVSERAFRHHSCTFYKLRKLSLAGYTSHLDFLSFLSKMTHLVELNLSCSRSHSMTWDNLIHSFLPIRLRHLSGLDLSYSLALGSLKRQSLFQSFIKTLRSTLTCLNLSCNTCVKNQHLQVLWHELHKLRILYLETLPSVTDEGFTGIRNGQYYGNEEDVVKGTQSKIVGYLNSSVVLRRHNKGAGQIGYCSNIETLSLANNQRLTDFVTQYGLQYLPNLRRLKLSGCTKISDRSLYFLIGSCPKLEYLDLRGCPSITEYWVNWAENSAASPKLKILLGSKPPQIQRLHFEQEQKAYIKPTPLYMGPLFNMESQRDRDNMGPMGRTQHMAMATTEDTENTELTTETEPCTEEERHQRLRRLQHGKKSMMKSSKKHVEGRQKQQQLKLTSGGDDLDADDDETEYGYADTTTDVDHAKHAIKIIMPRKYRLSTKKKQARQNLVILSPASESGQPTASSSRAATYVLEPEPGSEEFQHEHEFANDDTEDATDPLNGNGNLMYDDNEEEEEDEAFKIDIVDDNSNSL